MAQQFGCPIVPMTIVGSYEFNRKGSWMIYPAKIVVYLHDTIDTTSMAKTDVDALGQRVHSIVAAPIEAYYASGMRHPDSSEEAFTQFASIAAGDVSHASR